MIKKQFTPKRTICRVSFRIPEEWAEESVAIVGDFNEWDSTRNLMERRNGAWETLLRLIPGKEYRFRYFIDGNRWENDDAADDYLPNEYGSEDSLLLIGK